VEIARGRRYAHFAYDTAKCLREQWYGWMGIPVTNPMEDSVRRQQDAGKIYEAWLKEDIKKSGLWSGDEVSVSTAEPIASARIDVIFDMDALKHFYDMHKIDLGLARDLPETKSQVIPVEIKSVRTFAFEGGKDSHGYKDQPMWAHYCQIQLYLYMTDAPFGFLIYINREDANKSSHLVMYDEPLIHKLVDRQRALDWFVKNNTCPDREGAITFGDKGGLKLPRRCGICDWVYYDWFNEIWENGTRAEKSKMMSAIQGIPEKFLTEKMKEALEYGTRG
jgi:hypothetical protein